jgi:hypothetical protein
MSKIIALDRHLRFTAGDLIEGLSFLDVVARRATLFCLEQGLDPSRVVTLTHGDAARLPLTPIGRTVLRESPRHVLFPLLFWRELGQGVLSPLSDLEGEVSAAFAGMTWRQLRDHYTHMAWVDAEIEGEDFARRAREEGLF